MSGRYDVILVGGGLQSSLMALALLDRDRRCKVALIERGARLGADHTWSFHAADLPPEAERWAGPLVEHHWPEYEVAFPGTRRTLASPYSTISSTRLDEVVRAAFARAPSARLLLGAFAVQIEAEAVTLSSGERLGADRVVDARGPGRVLGGSAYQKFLGLELRVAGALPARPMVMDATVPQDEGLRFVYVLPFAEDRVLIEDTYYDESPVLDLARSRQRVLDYAAACGLEVIEILREERGALPLPLDGGPTPALAEPLIAGYAGGWLQPTTGYSFPVAVRLAAAFAADDAGAAIRALAEAHADQSTFLRRLNRWLFRSIAPEHRWRLFAKFYRLPEDTIARFYAMELGALERWRIILGAPPRGLRLGAALRAIGEA